VKEDKMGRACTHMGEKRNACRILVGKPDTKSPLRKLRCRLENNIKVDYGEIVWDGMDWIDLAQGRDQWSTLVNAVMNLQFHKMVGNS
jgi:hypothetical protein